MRAHLLAIKALIQPLGYPVHIGDVAGSATYPYVLLWASGGDVRADELDGAQDDLNDLVGVTMVASSADAALMIPPAVRAALIGARPVVAGRHVQPLRLYDSQRVQSDPQITLPSNNRHPAFVVDLYRLISEPKEA